MNLVKSYEYFKPESVQSRIHILGCGSVGSTVAENLVRFGLTKISLYDFDTVEPKNIVNQMFTNEDIGKSKVDAVTEMLVKINPEIKKDLKVYPKGYTGQILSGYVFLCVDNIDLRREIATRFKDNQNIKAMFDFRTRLTDAQHYAADWSNRVMVESFIDSMAFSREEARKETPVSACGTDLSVCPTIREIVSHGVMNFVNFVRSGEIKKMIFIDTERFDLVAL